MGDPRDDSPLSALDKDPLELRVEDVYDISYVIGKDLLKSHKDAQDVSELQFKIVRVLEMLETLVGRFSLSVEELSMERDSLKAELDRVVAEGSSNTANNQIVGPDKLVIDLKDPNRPRFTMQELKEVLQERNHLKAQLLVAQEELQLYKSGALPRHELNMVDVDLGTPPQEEHGDEKTTIQKLFSFRRK